MYSGPVASMLVEAWASTATGRSGSSERRKTRPGRPSGDGVMASIVVARPPPPAFGPSGATSPGNDPIPNADKKVAPFPKGRPRSEADFGLGCEIEVSFGGVRSRRIVQPG